jgi:hypothetical protein
MDYFLGQERNDPGIACYRFDKKPKFYPHFDYVSY